MTRLVLKFGGTSVADPDHICRVAHRIKQEVHAGYQVAVVVSAMSGETSRLVDYVHKISPLFDAREYDVVVSSGEQVTIGLLALALQEQDIDARSFMGWQVPIRTNDVHGTARITSIDTQDIQARLDAGQVCVIAGFQGIGPSGRVTTLGRGGSDTSAVALAAALNADRCDIYTDVEGIYTCDPRIISRARKLDKITYEEMLEMASLGARVLHTRSVEIAMNHKVRLQVRSTFSQASGTLIVNEDEIMEHHVVSGLAYSRDEAKITIVSVPDQPGIAARLFTPLAAHDINVDMIVQNVSKDGQATDMTFTVSRSDMKRALDVLSDQSEEIGFKELRSVTDVTKISVIGIGMRSHAGVATTMFQALADEGINISVISTSEIKISVLVDSKYTELALRALHTAYHLDSDTVSELTLRDDQSKTH